MSHATAVHPYPDAVKVREPVARPLDVVAVELLLSASQAFLVGVLMYLAIGVWDDRGVGLGSVAVILAMLGLAVGGSWAYWLLGGVGWPMAAANVPAAMFLGFALVLGWSGDDLFRVEGVPLLLGVIAAAYGVICGVFVDSPRRWRWDQRQKLRPGTQVPHVSETTRSLLAAMPRSLPRRAPVATDPPSELATRIEHSGPPGAEPSGEVSIPYATDGVARTDGVSEEREGAEAQNDGGIAASEPEADALDADVTGSGRSASPTPGPVVGPSSAEPRDPNADADEAPGAIELPTSVEPKAQRSPWAWAAPPEWNRDEDDEQRGGRA